MMRAVRSSFVLLLVLAALPAYGSVSVEDQLLQQGIYLKDGCTPAQSQEEYDDCVCEADIHYPQLTGLTDKTAESALNASFRSDAEAMHCEGKQISSTADKEKYGDDHASYTHHYEITFQSERITGFSFSDWVYTGGMQGDTKITGFIIDTLRGKPLTVADLFSTEGLQAVNDAIYTMLTAKPEGEVWHDQVEKRKGAFITEKGCNGCTLIVQKDGLHVVFKPYEVSPSIVEQVDLVLPAKLLRDADIFSSATQSTSSNSAAH